MSIAMGIVHGQFGRVALLGMNKSLVQHAHPHCHVLIKVKGPDTRFKIGNRFVPLTDMSAVLINAWDPHAYIHNEAHSTVTVLALYIEADWLSMFRSNWISSRSTGFFDSPIGELTPRTRKIAVELAESMLYSPADLSLHEALLSTFMISIIERFAAWRTVNDDHIPRFDWRVARAMKLARTNMCATRSVSSFAREAGLSRAHLYRLFGRSSGMTPHLYLNLLQLEEAVSAVVSTNDKFSSISETLGFSGQGQLTRFFSSHTGVAPSEFRNVARYSDSVLSPGASTAGLMIAGPLRL